MQQISERICPTCGARFHGRADKKFCSDQCRSTSHNQKQRNSAEYVRYVNNVLRKNRMILEQLAVAGKRKVVPELLRMRGFDFNYYTSAVQKSDGHSCFFCYDQGYEPLDEHTVLIIKRDCFWE